MKKAIAALTAILIITVAVVAAALAAKKVEVVTYYIYESDQRGRPENPGKPDKPPKPDKPEGYKILAKWDGTVSYVYNTNNPDGLTQEYIATTLQLASEEWDDHTGYELANPPTADDTAGFHDYMNQKNEISFGDYPQTGVIAVCRMWITRGKPSTRRIVEFDIQFDTDYQWGDATVDPTVMDIQNIATHELGHGIAGLDDMTSDTELTMYAYSTYGETKKRTLEPGDIRGVQENYGE